ncbi:hypothetical protein, partial [Cypionkella sp.]|uniref:hypothetical protein n=1 Tax=Cypionkella sp. TaxID=2811411 RepID=UPI002ABA29A3
MNKMVTKAAPLETFQVVADRLFVTGEPGTAVGNKNARIARRLIWFCRMANLPPETTPASVGTMMKFFDANRPATFNLSPGTYAVYRSEMLSVLKPEPVQKGRYILQMQGVYREVHDLTVKSDLPEQFRWRCAPLLWYLHDNSILPRDIADDTLIKYYQFNLEVVRVPEDQARRRAQDGAKFIS